MSDVMQGYDLGVPLKLKAIINQKVTTAFPTADN